MEGLSFAFLLLGLALLSAVFGTVIFLGWACYLLLELIVTRIERYGSKFNKLSEDMEAPFGSADKPAEVGQQLDFICIKHVEGR
ncbi:hypothetical protein HDU77_000167 [Chytriomyces hyalinus]|nr:hypothetical protein HDU77_000167 [Chytriomyces hyalinus]